MKHLFKRWWLGFLCAAYFPAMSQSVSENMIRSLEEQERQAVLKGDTTALFKKLWAPELIVNNPANLVVTRPQIMDLIKAGKIDYETFYRAIERISIIDNTAIVMGREELSPQSGTDNSSKHVVRRFTNIWIKRNGDWRLAGRQATVISIR